MKINMIDNNSKCSFCRYKCIWDAKEPFVANLVDVFNKNDNIICMLQ